MLSAPCGLYKSNGPAWALAFFHQGLEERMTTSHARLLGSLGKANLEEAFGGISCGLP